MNWSPQQQAIFAWFASGVGNLVVRARAGTGKTTTILEGISQAKERRILLCAFNKHIAEEMAKRLKNQWAKAATLHSVGFRLLREHFGQIDLDGDRGFDIAKAAVAEYVVSNDLGGSRYAPARVAKLVSRLKSTHPTGCSEEEAEEVALEFDCGPTTEMELAGWLPLDVACCALLALERAKQVSSTVDFDDMVFLPVALGLARPLYDLVVIDEAQDLNKAQLLLAHQVVSPRGRVAVIGDDRQAIYSFRGADSGALDRMKSALQAIEMPLTVTRRCPKSVVQRARILVGDFEAAPEAPDGVVDRITLDSLAALAEVGDFILSRTNAPLVSACLSLLRKRKRARILGRDVGKELTEIIAKTGARPADPIAVLLPRVEEWRASSVKRWEEAAESDDRVGRVARRKIQTILDQAETIVALCDLDGAVTVTDLYRGFEKLFSDHREEQTITLSSVHKAKGLEANRVFVLEDTLYVYGMFKDSREEQNIDYVATTRAKSILTLVYDPNARRAR